MIKKTPDWKICENTKRQQYSQQGCLVIPTGKGSDFLAICLGKKPTLVEVKKGCQPLTKLQRKTMKEAPTRGLEYTIERCDCPKSERKVKTED